MDLANIDPNFYGIVGLILVIKYGFSFLEKVIFNKKKDNNEDVKDLIKSIQEVMNQVAMALTTNNERLSQLINDSQKVHASTLQAVTIMAEGSETMKEKVRDIQQGIDKIDDFMRERK